ncbi:aldolase [Halobacillus sp. A5]|uniref:aldolase n=1 Tax=Halobacillus sp. A5 TaxID=2880263 RepID=UPI0020A6D9ED|nr:aldolase [Halobacillus sp. A5]MCP3029178.1 aldolase [Halobacillus sp. A5]
MPVTSKQIMYTAFGFNIMSELSLPELLEINHKTDFDLYIQQKDLLDEWNVKTVQNRNFYVEAKECLFRIPNVAIYKIENGKRIYFHAFDEAEEDQLRLYILGTCMGSVLMQRKILPLHGSAVEIDGKAYAVVGHSGAGKSTTASAILNRGFQLVSDDVIPVTVENGIPMVTPAYPQQKLWQESLDGFGMESERYRPIINRESKYAIPVSDKFYSKKLPLAGIIELEKVDGEEIQFEQIEKLHGLHTIFNHTYRNFMIPRMGLVDWHFSVSAQICSYIDLYTLKRPKSRFTAHELTDLLLSKLEVHKVGKTVGTITESFSQPI